MRRSSERLERLEHQSNRPLGVLHTVPVSMYEKAIAKGWWTRVKSKTRGGYGLPNTLLSNIIKVPNYCFTQPAASPPPKTSNVRARNRRTVILRGKPR